MDTFKGFTDRSGDRPMRAPNLLGVGILLAIGAVALVLALLLT